MSPKTPGRPLRSGPTSASVIPLALGIAAARITYRAPEARSTLEMARTYERTLDGLEFTTLHTGPSSHLAVARRTAERADLIDPYQELSRAGTGR
jgi:hypothetical protein